MSLSFSDLSLEDGINRVLEAAGERNFAATFGRVATNSEGGYRLQRVAVLRNAAVEPDEIALPPDLDTTRPPGMFIDEKRLRYLGKGRIREPVVHLGEGERLLRVLQRAKNYDSILIMKGGRYYARILDKAGNLVFEKEEPRDVFPIFVGDTDAFVEHKAIRYLDNERPPVRGGLTFFDLKGQKTADVSPEMSGEIAIRTTTPDGLIIVKAGGGLDIYTPSGEKLSHVANVWFRFDLSPDSRYLYAQDSNLSDHTNGSYLYDLNGHLIARVWGKVEEGADIVAVSRDSRFFAYQKTDLSTRERMTHLVDMQSLETVRSPAIIERPMAISDGGSYIGAFGMSSPRETGSGIFPKYFRFYDGRGALLSELALGDDKGGVIPARVTFVSKTRVKAVYGEDVYYFESLGGEE